MAVLLVALIALVAGCAAVPPPVARPVAHAPAPQPGGVLEMAELSLHARHGPEISGFSLLERSADALAWRLALVDSARYTLDMQYYVWFGDAVGSLLMRRVVVAADRGVKVRLLFDDLDTMLRTMETLEIQDALVQRIDAHPNIEVRLFNPWHARGLVGRGVETLHDFKRLDRRMHNKQMIADNRAAIIGGRNIGDEYFGLNADFNFLDLDVVGIGPVARQASTVFDRYWNSQWVGSTPPADASVVAVSSTREHAVERRLAKTQSLQHVALAPQDWSAWLTQRMAQMSPGRSVVHTDSPSRGEGDRNHMPEAIRGILHGAQREVLITNAYIIPDAAFMADLRLLQGRKVDVRILTNSLSSHDVPAVNSHYEVWRRDILRSGVALHELRSDASLRNDVVDLPPTRSGFVGLHTKAMVIDERRVFVGSMNLDPRSELLNSEMGVLIDSPPLAETLKQRMARDMDGTNSWLVRLESDGTLSWTSDAGQRTLQPARSFWQRVENLLFKLLPVELY
jgi:putative cardiolipin synthase